MIRYYIVKIINNGKMTHVLFMDIHIDDETLKKNEGSVAEYIFKTLSNAVGDRLEELGESRTQQFSFQTL